jgi:hypothetical protein
MHETATPLITVAEPEIMLFLKITTAARPPGRALNI